ncbi:MAG: hypothetical protein LBU65_15385 [Planctomycetaceae bacterium]|jgi:hypothetical protein|nr:hypothetical protein [Planctomycetaceae bacterium]
MRIFVTFFTAVVYVVLANTVSAQWRNSDAPPLLVAPNSGQVLAPEDEAEMNEILRVAGTLPSPTNSYPKANNTPAQPSPATRLPVVSRLAVPTSLETEVTHPSSVAESKRAVVTKPPRRIEPVETADDYLNNNVPDNTEGEIIESFDDNWTPMTNEQTRRMLRNIVGDDGFIPVEGAIYDEQTLAMLQQMPVQSVNGMNAQPLAEQLMSGGVYTQSTVGNPAFGYQTNGYAPLMSGGRGGAFLQNLTINMGAAGFASELDGAANANFGFSEGFNWSGPVTPLSTLSGQFGFQSLQSNFTGSTQTKNHRTQYMFTTGLFLRSQHKPLQMGVVYDWLQDNYAGKYRVEQIRTELSYKTYGQYEYGFLGGFGTKTDSNAWTTYIQTGKSKIAAASYYMFFVRKNLLIGGIGRLEFGMSEYGDTLFGGKIELPINDKVELNTTFRMSIPKEGRGGNGFQKESWNVGLNFVYHFKGGVLNKQQNPLRPMFDVVDNGSVLQRVVR